MPSLPIVSIWPETSHRRLLQALTVLAALGLGFPAVSESRPRDRDGDGLSNRVELRKTHTSPRRADTDRDGLGDRDRGAQDAHRLRGAPTPIATVSATVSRCARSRTNPRHPDTDGDGLRDGYEVHQSHTKPRQSDTDARWLAGRARASVEDGSAQTAAQEAQAGRPTAERHDASGDIHPLRPLRDGHRRARPALRSAPRRPARPSSAARTAAPGGRAARRRRTSHSQTARIRSTSGRPTRPGTPTRRRPRGPGPSTFRRRRPRRYDTS